MCLILKSIGYPSGIEKTNFNITYKTPLGEEVAAEYTNTTNGIKVSKDGEYTITTSSEDKAGNVSESSNVLTVKIDKTPPESLGIEIVSGTLGNNGYYVTEVGIKIKLGNDNYSGIDSGHYDIYKNSSLSSGGSISEGETITLTGDGEYKIIAYNYDDAGNRSEITELSFKIDQTAPNKPKINIEGTLDEEGVYTGAINITIEDDGDNYSGVAYTKYRLTQIAYDDNGIEYKETGDYEEGNQFELTISGIYKIEAYCVDEAGNFEEDENKCTTDEIIINYWTQDGTTVEQDRMTYNDFDGVHMETISLNVGDFVNYDSEQDYYEHWSYGTSYATKKYGWVVLGTDENGRLLLVSAYNVNDEDGNQITNEAYIYYRAYGDVFIDYTEKYGEGEYSVGNARALTVEDINKITNYEPKYDWYEKYGEEGPISAYGRIIEYSIDYGEYFIQNDVVDDLDLDGLSKSIPGETYGAFVTPNNVNLISEYDDDLGGEVSWGPHKESVELTNTFYRYNAKECVENGSIIYEVLFNDENYVLASRYCKTKVSCAYWGIRTVKDGEISGNAVWTSRWFDNKSYLDKTMFGQRAVVTMSSKAIVNVGDDFKDDIDYYGDWDGYDFEAWQLKWIDK